MKNLLLSTLVLMTCSISVQAQDLCFYTKVQSEQTDALLSLYAQPNEIAPSAQLLENRYELASFSTQLDFDGSKMEFVKVEYNALLWESAFADPNPSVAYIGGKSSKKSSSIYLDAVDFKPSSKTYISTPTLLYTARFRSKSGKGTSIKTKDFRFRYAAVLDTMSQTLVDSTLMYGNYVGNEYPIRMCTAPHKRQALSAEQEEFITHFAPNPSCDRLHVRTAVVTQEKYDEMDLDDHSATLSLYDLSGNRQVYHKQMVVIGSALNWEVSLQSITRGLHLVVIEVGRQKYKRKLLVVPCQNDVLPTNNQGAVKNAQ